MGTLATALRILTTGLTVALAGCAGLPARVDPQPSSVYADTSDTQLGRAFSGAVAAHPGQTGVLPLRTGREAFAARMIIARAAERSIDVQYYIWHADTTGNLLFEALWNAAERGARVRLLLDDQNTRGMDPTLAALDSHPNVEVRLFNPFANRSFRIADFATSFSRVNRRMHNKSFTVDNQVAILGGPQHRRRVLRGRHVGRLHRPRHGRAGRGRSRRLGAVRRLLEQRLGVSARRPATGGGCRRGGRRCAMRGRRCGRAPTPPNISTRCARRRSCSSSSRARSNPRGCRRTW
jgi:hypothetical protein